MHVNLLHYNLIKTFYIIVVKHIWGPSFAVPDDGETVDEMCGLSCGISMSYACSQNEWMCGLLCGNICCNTRCEKTAATQHCPQVRK
jgi:hypothetical protein